MKNNRYDGMIITGAPVETMAFEQVDYWPELCEIMDFSETNVYSTLHVCWGAQAGLYYHYGVRKEILPQKMFGVFEHRVTRPSNPLVRGFDEVFYAPTAVTPASPVRMWTAARHCASLPRATRPGRSS